MAEENQQTQETPVQPGRPSPFPENPGTPQNNRQPRRDRGRYPGGQRHHFRRDQPQNPDAGRPVEPAEENAGTDDDEETEHDRSAPQHRHRSGGRPEKRIIEEWANDPYCE